MSIEKCNEYRTRMQLSMPRTCEECGLGPCYYAKDAVAFHAAINDSSIPLGISGSLTNTTPIPSREALMEAIAAHAAHHPTMINIDFKTGQTINAVTFEKAIHHTSITRAIATERIETGEAVCVFIDNATGMAYASKYRS